MCNDKPKSSGNVPTFSRVNGWSLPLNGLQTLAWLVEVYLFLLLFGAEILSLSQNAWVPCYVCMGLLSLVHVIALISATTINPADDNARDKLLNRNHRMPTFDRSQHRHVIENHFCHLCEVTVGLKSKHCSSCNKCVSVFDHHCKWLNNCVGEKNYRLFLLSIFTGLIGAIAMLIISLFVFINAVQNFKNLNQGVWWSNGGSLIALDVLIGIKIVILLMCVLLLSQLLFFHIMLIYKGLTTYDYIKQSLAKSEAKKLGRSSSPTPSMDNGAICNTPSEVVESGAPVTPSGQEQAKKEVPGHALLKGNKNRLYSMSRTSGSLAHENEVFTHDDGQPIDPKVITTSLNDSNNSNQGQTQRPSHVDAPDLPNVVPGDGKTNTTVV